MIDEALRQAQAGRGGLIPIEGPAGIGKSQLLGEGRREGRARGLRCLHGRGAELERGMAFGIARHCCAQRCSR